jgi:hypothetical protein
MAQAKITVNSVIGSNDQLPIATLVQLNNINVGGESTFNWAILDQPVGPPDSLSSLSVQNPTFTPNKEGTYLIQLTVNLGLPTEEQDSIICAVRQEKTYQRIPAAGETTQDNQAEGWAIALNSYLEAMDTQLADPGTIVGVDQAGGLISGNIVTATASAIIKGGLPGQETIPGFTLATSAGINPVSSLCAIVLQSVAATPTGGPFSAGQIIKTKYIGRVPAQPLAGASVGQIVYMSDTGVLSLTPGTNRRQLGTVMAVSGSTADVWFDGVGGFEITPVGAKYLTNGPESELVNSTDVTHLTTTLHFAQNTGYYGDLLHLDALAGNTGNFIESTLAGTQVFSLGPDATLTIYNSGGTYQVQLTPAGRGGFKTIGYLSGAGGGTLTVDSNTLFDQDSRVFGWPDVYTKETSVVIPGYATVAALLVSAATFGTSPTEGLALAPSTANVGTSQHWLAALDALSGLGFYAQTTSNIAFRFLGNAVSQTTQPLHLLEAYLTSYASVEALFAIEGDGKLTQNSIGYYDHYEMLQLTGIYGVTNSDFNGGLYTPPPNLPQPIGFKAGGLDVVGPSHGPPSKYYYLPAVTLDVALVNSVSLGPPYPDYSQFLWPEILYQPIDTSDAWFDNGSTSLDVTFTVLYYTHNTSAVLQLEVTPLPLNTITPPTYLPSATSIPTPQYVSGFTLLDCGTYVVDGSAQNQIARSSVTATITGMEAGTHLAVALQRTDTVSGLIYILGVAVQFRKTLT